MKQIRRIWIFSLCWLLVLNTCDNPRLNFDKAIIPLVPQNIYAVNSIYDDYNSTIVVINARHSFVIIFSTNRMSQGDNYDLVSFDCELSMDLLEGHFEFSTYGPNEGIRNFNLNEINSEFNELGPYAIFDDVSEFWYNPETQSDVFTTIETHRRIFYANDRNGHLDIYCSFYHEYHQEDITLVDHVNMSSINSAFDDAYPTIMADSMNGEILYFTSNRDGDYDIFSAVGLDNDFVDLAASVTITKVPGLSSEADDKCPNTSGDLMVLASNRDGGYGGFDLYYSVYNGDDWSAPVNLGPAINTEYDEYRPVIVPGYEKEFSHDLLIYSSNRPGGQGGYDLYYVGIEMH